MIIRIATELWLTVSINTVVRKIYDIAYTYYDSELVGGVASFVINPSSSNHSANLPSQWQGFNNFLPCVARCLDVTAKLKCLLDDIIIENILCTACSMKFISYCYCNCDMHFASDFPLILHPLFFSKRTLYIIQQYQNSNTSKLFLSKFKVLLLRNPSVKQEGF